MDLSQVSDEELMRAAGVGSPAPRQDLSHFSDEQLAAAAGIKTPSLFARAANDVSSRFDEAKQQATLQGAIGKMVGGTMNDAAGYAMKTGYNALPTPVQQGIEGAANYVANTAPGQAVLGAVKQGTDAYGQFAQAHPKIAANAEGLADFGMMLPMGKASAAVSEATGTGLSKVGQGLVDAAENKTIASKGSFLQDLITPKATPSVKSDLFSRSTEQGLFRNAVAQPTEQELGVIESLSDLPLSKSNSLLKNYNIIADANQAEANGLRQSLANSGVMIDPNGLKQNLAAGLDSVKQEPLIVGDGEVTANRVFQKMSDLVEQNASTPDGLLTARQQFDQWAKSKKGSVFDSNQTAFSSSVMQARDIINKQVAEAVPDAGVKTSLAKQSNLYRAMDAIETKGGQEAPNMLKRAADKAASVIPGKTVMTKGAIGAVGLGTAAASPALAAGALTGYGMYKTATSPGLWKSLGLTLDAAGNVLRFGKPITQREVMSLPPAVAKDVLRLPAPQSSLIADSKGAIRFETSAERDAAILARNRASDIGLTPDVSKAQAMFNRLTRSPEWDQLEAAQRQQIADEINRAYQENQIPLDQIVDDAERTARELASAKGERYSPTAFSQALRSAIKK